MVLKKKLKMVTVLLSPVTTVVLFTIYCGIASIRDPNQNSFSPSLNLEFQLKQIHQPTGFQLNYKDYTSTVESLQWYRQYPRSKPEFLLYIFPRGAMGDRPNRFSAEVQRDQSQAHQHYLEFAYPEQYNWGKVAL
ncbi:unnamed protein product [Leuciscus chuanchicus]